MSSFGLTIVLVTCISTMVRPKLLIHSFNLILLNQHFPSIGGGTNLVGPALAGSILGTTLYMHSFKLNAICDLVRPFTKCCLAVSLALLPTQAALVRSQLSCCDWVLVTAEAFGCDTRAHKRAG